MTPLATKERRPIRSTRLLHRLIAIAVTSALAVGLLVELGGGSPQLGRRSRKQSSA